MTHMHPQLSRWLRLGGCFMAASLVGGCDPTINFYGSFFPAWIWCLLLGIALAIPLRFLFAALRLERNLGSLLLVYLCLVLLLSCIAWLVLFQS